jgi:CBS domain-containing protein
MQGQAKDIMTRDVATAAPGDDVWETAARLVDRGYGGMPVLSETGEPVGMVSGSTCSASRARPSGRS